MTYKQLAVAINLMTEEEKECHVLMLDENEDLYFSIVKDSIPIGYTKDEPTYKDNHPYLVF